jgi:hypothetical protein
MRGARARPVYQGHHFTANPDKEQARSLQPVPVSVAYTSSSTIQSGRFGGSEVRMNFVLPLLSNG